MPLCTTRGYNMDWTHSMFPFQLWTPFLSIHFFLFFFLLVSLSLSLIDFFCPLIVCRLAAREKNADHYSFPPFDPRPDKKREREREDRFSIRECRAGEAEKRLQHLFLFPGRGSLLLIVQNFPVSLSLSLSLSRHCTTLSVLSV